MGLEFIEQLIIVDYRNWSWFWEQSSFSSVDSPYDLGVEERFPKKYELSSAANYVREYCNIYPELKCWSCHSFRTKKVDENGEPSNVPAENTQLWEKDVKSSRSSEPSDDSDIESVDVLKEIVTKEDRIDSSRVVVPNRREERVKRPPEEKVEIVICYPSVVSSNFFFNVSKWDLVDDSTETILDLIFLTRILITGFEVFSLGLLGSGKSPNHYCDFPEEIDHLELDVNRTNVGEANVEVRFSLSSHISNRVQPAVSSEGVLPHVHAEVDWSASP